jgi:hypothetical protein
MKVRVLAILGLFLGPATLCAEIVEYPFLQPTTNLEHSIGIVWETKNQAGGKVQYGLDMLDQSAAPAYAGKSHLGNHRYQIRLENLSAGKKYKYKVVSDGTETLEYTFRTSSRADDFTYRVLLLSDTHCSPKFLAADREESVAGSHARLQSVLKAMEQFDPQLVLHCGDVVTADGRSKNDSFSQADEQYLAAHTIFKDLFARAIFAPSAGNHDYARDGAEPPAGTKDTREKSYRVFTDNYFLPENGPEPTGDKYAFVKEGCYSFNYGGIFYQVYGIGYWNIGQEDGKQAIQDLWGWLESGLRNAARSGKTRNTILFGHIVSGRGSSNDGFTRRMDQYHPALAFLGHDHNLTRLAPARLENGSVQYFTGSTNAFAGNVGLIYHRVPSTWYAKGETSSNAIAFSKETGFSTMEISKGGRVIAGKTYVFEGSEACVKEIDAFTITRDISVGGTAR